MTRKWANLLLLMAGAVWGMGFVAQSTAMDSLGPFAFTALKFLLAAVTLVPFALAERRRSETRLDRKSALGFVAVGAALFLAAITQQIGIVTTSVTNSGFLTGLYVVFTPLLALTLLREWPHRVVWPAALTAFLGIALLGGGDIAALNQGDLWTITCALFWALQILLVGVVVGPSGRPYALSLVQFAVTGVFAGIGALLTETTTLADIGAARIEILYGGVFSTALAFTLQIVGQRYTTASQAAIFLSSEALFAGLFAALVLGERIGPIGLFGCGLIFAAMLAVELVPTLDRTSRPAAMLARIAPRQWFGRP